MIHVLIMLVVIAVIASLCLFAVRSAPEPVINATFKGVLSWIIIVAAVIFMVVLLLRALNISV
jgi:hypothetical protein